MDATTKSNVFTENLGRRVFNGNHYKAALNIHYGRLLKLSEATVGRPSQREIVMLEKIRKLENRLAEERELQTESWNPLREKITTKALSTRDRDIQIGIYSIEVSMQSISTIDSAFDKVLKSAADELIEVEEEFRTRTLPGAPKFGKHVSINLNNNKHTRKKNHAQRIIGGSHIPSKHQAVTKIPATIASSFPVYFSDNLNASTGGGGQKIELTGMSAEEEEQKAIERLIVAESRERDYEIFIVLADRFGALPPELFCTSRQPGRLYENLIYASATLLQLWWKIIWPHRKLIKEVAARLLQKIWRGRQSRLVYRAMLYNEEKVKLCLRRLFFKLQIRVLVNWQSYAQQCGKVKAFARRMMQGMEKHVFETWRAKATALRREREERVRLAIAKYFNRFKYKILHQWDDYTQKMKKMKAMLSRRMSALEHVFFSDWALYVKRIIRGRNRLKGALTIQRFGRGMIGRRKWDKRHQKYTLAVQSIQRIVRGHLGRRKTDIKLRNVQKRLRKAARRARRDQLRTMHEISAQKEGQRLKGEDVAMEKAADVAVETFMKNIRPRLFVVLKGKERRQMLSDKRQLNARFLFLESEYRAGKISVQRNKNVKSSLSQLAIQQLSAERGEAARKEARIMYRQQHPKFFDRKEMNPDKYFE